MPGDSYHRAACKTKKSLRGALNGASIYVPIDPLNTADNTYSTSLRGIPTDASPSIYHVIISTPHIPTRPGLAIGF